MPARAARVPCAPWFGIHAVSRPSGPQAAAAARVSIGAGATRWLAMVRETTTSQPSNRSAARAAASPKVAATLVLAGGEQHGRVGRVGLGHIDDGGQHVIVDIHQVGGVLALVAALGDDHRHRLADVPDHVLGQQRLAHVLVEHAGYRRGHRREVSQVGPGERGDDAGCRERGADVDREDPRVRDGRPDEVHVAGACQLPVLDVRGVDAAGGQEAGIFGSDDPGAQYAHGHDLAWPRRRWSKLPRAAGRGRPRGGDGHRAEGTATRGGDGHPGAEDRVPFLR